MAKARFVNKGIVVGTQVRMFTAVQKWADENDYYLCSIRFTDNPCKCSALIIGEDYALTKCVLEIYSGVKSVSYEIVIPAIGGQNAKH